MPVSSVNSYGSFRTGAVRLRAGWFGIAILEELWEKNDGERRWERATKFNLSRDARETTTPPPAKND